MEQFYVVVCTDMDDLTSRLCRTATKQNLFKSEEEAQYCIDDALDCGYTEFKYRIAKLSWID